MIAVLLVAAGSSLGAPTRYLLDRAIQSRHERIFPWGTLVVNVSGSLLLGLVSGLADHHGIDGRVTAGVTTGLLGGYTTFSTFTWESMQLIEEGAVLEAMTNLVVSVSIGGIAAALGLAIGSTL